MEKNVVKLSFVGDIMCEKPQLSASKKVGFDEMFSKIKEYFNDTFVVGNLETPISNVFGYTNDLYCFNTSNKFLKSLKNAKFDLLVTANNHCLDRGIIGLNQTMKNIKKNKLDYVGTYINEKEREQIKIKDINGVKVAFIAYTYGTNYGYTHYPLNKKNEYKVNLLKEQISDTRWKNGTQINSYMFLLKKYVKECIKKMINYPISNYEINTNDSIVIDELGKGEWQYKKDKIDKIKKDIQLARKDSDIVVLMIHSGGQFNSEPGSFTKCIMEELSKEDIDCIIGTHPHVVQKSEYVDDKLITYSLGNFSISPSTPYINFELLPEYSIMLNCYIDNVNKKIKKYTFTILKAVEDENNYLRVYTLKDLIEFEKDNLRKEKLIQDNLFIYNRFLNRNEKEIKIELEYNL